MSLEFNDGLKFNTNTKLHVEKRRDGYYVVGRGMVVPVDDQQEGNQLIEEWEAEDKDSATRPDADRQSPA